MVIFWVPPWQNRPSAWHVNVVATWSSTGMTPSKRATVVGGLGVFFLFPHPLNVWTDGGHIFAEKRCVWNSRQQIFFPNSFGYIYIYVYTRILTSSIGVRVRRFFGFILLFWGGLSGRVPSEWSSDVQLVVCTGECTQIIWIRFGGQQVSSI